MSSVPTPPIFDDSKEAKRAHTRYLWWSIATGLLIAVWILPPYVMPTIPDSFNETRKHLQGVLSRPLSPEANEAEQRFYRFASLRGISNVKTMTITSFEGHEVSLSQVQLELDPMSDAMTGCVVITPMPDSKVAFFYHGPCSELKTEEEVLERLADTQ